MRWSSWSPLTSNSNLGQLFCKLSMELSALHFILGIIPYYCRSSPPFFLKVLFFHFIFQFPSGLPSLFFFPQKTAGDKLFDSLQFWNELSLHGDWLEQKLASNVDPLEGRCTCRLTLSSLCLTVNILENYLLVVGWQERSQRKRVQYKITLNRAFLLECSPEPGGTAGAGYF